MAKIAIDARFLGPEGTGLGKYTEKLIENLEKIDQENEYFIILRQGNFHLFNPTSKNFHKIRVDVRWYTLKEQFFIPWSLRNLQIDLLHVPHFNAPLVWNKKLVITIHDLIKSKHKGREATTLPTPLYWLKDKGYELVIRSALKKARAVLTPSKYSAQAIVDFGGDENKIHVTYEAADDYFLTPPKISSTLAEAMLLRYGIKKPYLLYVGNAYPYKNLPVVLKALKLLPEAITLVNVSARDSFGEKLVTEAEKIGVRHRILLTGYVPNEDLLVLHQNSLAYVFPSLSEGFGIPGLDALALKEPLLAAQATCLPEVYGDAALYFDPHSPEDLAEKVTEIQSDKRLKAKLIDNGYDQVHKYSWSKMAEQTLAVYQEVISKP